MNDMGVTVIVLSMLMCTFIAVVAMVLDHEKKKAKKFAEPPIPPAPTASQTSVLAGFSFMSALTAIFMVTSAAILANCVSMNEITGIPESAVAALNLAARIVLYVSILPAVCAVAFALGARGSINESRQTLRGRSLYRAGVFLSMLSGVLVADARVVNPATWKTNGLNWSWSWNSHSKADPSRGYLGIEHEDLDAGGTKVLRVVPGSPAEAAGLKAGDVIVTIDGARLLEKSSFVQVVAGLKPSARVTLGVRRGDGDLIPLTAVLAPPFSSLLELLEDAVTDSERVTLLKTAGANRPLTSAELEEICETFVTDSSREDAVTLVLPRVVDPQNAYQILSTFVTSSAKQSVSRKILEQTNSKK